MLSIAVCDDELLALRQIAELIRTHCPDCGVECYQSADGLLAAAERFDILFLDIQMQGLNGIETARRLRARGVDAVIIFITGAKEYVFDAFDVGAFHYLLKPVRAEKLREVLARAAREVRARPGQQKRRLFIKTRERSFSVPVADILFLQNAGRRLLLHTGRETICFYGRMAEYEKQLGDGFFRSHRGYLVNLAQVAEYDAENIRFANGEQAYLAKERYRDFVKQYMRFLQSGEWSYV